MKSEKFNPYNSSQYFNLPKPPRLLTPREGMSLVGAENYRRIRREAEKAMQQEYYMSKDRRLHRSGKDALLGSQAAELGWGIRDCGNDPDLV